VKPAQGFRVGVLVEKARRADCAHECDGRFSDVAEDFLVEGQGITIDGLKVLQDQDERIFLRCMAEEPAEGIHQSEA